MIKPQPPRRGENSNAMALYLVVHHHQDRQQPFHNIWLDNDDELLKSIQTKFEIGELCRQEMDMNHRVYIHRCGCLDLGIRPMICCSVLVADVAVIGGRVIVEFRDQKRLLNSTPSEPPPPDEGQSYYQDPART
jgi:hypothetical protein